MFRQSVLVSACRQAILCGLLFSVLPIFAVAQAKPEEVVFHSGKLELHGFLWKPPGPGPFPAILWNHGSEKLPGALDSVAPFFVARGYVFFVPHRRGQGRSPGPYIMDQLKSAGSPAERSARLVALHQLQLGDQL